MKSLFILSLCMTLMVVCFVSCDDSSGDLLVIPGGNSEKYVYNQTFTGEISEDEKWNGSINLTGDVTIPAGKTLIIEAGTTVTVPEDAAIINNGRLIVSGEAGNTVLFTGSTETPGWWEGIQTVTAEYLNVQYAEIKDANIGIYATYSWNITIRNVKIHECNKGIHLASTISFITRCDVIDNTTYGIVEHYSSGDNNFSYCNISGNGSSGTYAGITVSTGSIKPSSPYFYECNIQNNTGLAITTLGRLYNCYVADNNSQAGYDNPASAGSFNYTTEVSTDQTVADMVSGMRTTPLASIGCGW